MLKALVVKELRESVGIVALAGVAAIFALSSLVGFALLPIFAGENSTSIPFVSDAFGFWLTVVVGALALGLGLKQSAWEFGHSTYRFLLHRPVQRAAVFGTKLGVGTALTLSVGAAMILIYSIWAATPGKSGAPFAWSMTLGAWQSLLCLVVVYLSSFLSGIRPGKWFGTRLAPVVAGIGIALFIQNALWSWIVPIVVIIAAGVMLSAIFYYVAQRDY